jgi:hypothetical protein
MPGNGAMSAPSCVQRSSIAATQSDLRTTHDLHSLVLDISSAGRRAPLGPSSRPATVANTGRCS